MTHTIYKIKCLEIRLENTNE